MKKAEGRRQRAEGSNMVWASDPHQLQATFSRDFGGGLKPKFGPVTLCGHEAELPSAFCLLPSAFLVNILIYRTAILAPVVRIQLGILNEKADE
ncbi:MAG: hypothetical protein V7K27_10425 [Nostoc sp.]|uniref:hypothetical protein n=1 Tax=Nostoc sp. TaxID=1180 RepID=UPI002FFC08BD